MRYSYLTKIIEPCSNIEASGLNVITTSISAFLIIIFTILYKRRSCCLNKFKCSNFGLPMIISLWNKTERIHSALIYARIAFELYILLAGLLPPASKTLPLITLPPGVTDPTGLFNLLVKIIAIILIGLRK
jgi:hypothetical protein